LADQSENRNDGEDDRLIEILEEAKENLQNNIKLTKQAIEPKQAAIKSRI
jgi:hypothetical protein